jgi:Putative Flp pilus-assembly TadE/G-like
LRRPITCERGQMTVFVVGMALVAFAVVAFAADGTRAFLMRRTLQNAADAAALAGASQLDEQSYYSSKGGRVDIDPAEGERGAAAWLSRRALDAGATIHASESEVSVVLRTEMQTTLLGIVGIGSISVAAEAVAEPLTGPPED